MVVLFLKPLSMFGHCGTLVFTVQAVDLSLVVEGCGVVAGFLVSLLGLWVRDLIEYYCPAVCIVGM
jgi:hypothetical protein